MRYLFSLIACLVLAAAAAAQFPAPPGPVAASGANSAVAGVVPAFSALLRSAAWKPGQVLLALLEQRATVQPIIRRRR